MRILIFFNRYYALNFMHQKNTKNIWDNISLDLSNIPNKNKIINKSGVNKD